MGINELNQAINDLQAQVVLVIAKVAALPPESAVDLTSQVNSLSSMTAALVAALKPAA